MRLPHSLAVLQRLRLQRRGAAQAGGHDGVGGSGRQHMPMPTARMVGVAMGDHRPINTARRIDIEIPRLDIEPRWRHSRPGLRCRRSTRPYLLIESHRGA